MIATKRMQGLAWLLLLFLFPSIGSAGDLSEVFLQVEGESRRFLVYDPFSGQPPASAPLLLMFHGRGGSAEDAASSTYGWRSLADSERFYVVFPQALVREAFFLDPSGDPEGIKWDIPLPLLENPEDSLDLHFVQAILDYMEEHFPVNPERIFTTGHSYGAVMSHYAATLLQERVKAFGEHSGGLLYYEVFSLQVPYPLTVSDFGPIPGILIHSTDDGIVPYEWSQNLFEAMQAHGSTVEFISLDSFGHAWDASRNQAQWDFFLAQSGGPLPEEPSDEGEESSEESEETGGGDPASPSAGSGGCALHPH